MTGIFPSALPAAAQNTAATGAHGSLIGVQEAGFAAFFGQQVTSAPVKGIMADLPIVSEERAEAMTDATPIPEFAGADGLTSEDAVLPDGLGASVSVEVSSRLPAPALLPTDHGANLLRVRMDGAPSAAGPTGSEELAPSQPAPSDGGIAWRPTMELGVADSDQHTRLQGMDLLSDRKGAVDRPGAADSGQPPQTVAAAPQAPAVFDTVRPVAESTISGDLVKSDEVASSGDQTPVQTVQEARRSSHETVTFHRVAGGHTPAERQILAAIIASPSGRTEILLDPQDLGRVRLSLEGDESALVLTIQADRVDTADLLRRNADLLVEEFREAGYQNLTFSFSDQGRAAADDQPAGHDFGTDDAPPAANLVADLSPRRITLGGLDLRL